MKRVIISLVFTLLISCGLGFSLSKFLGFFEATILFFIIQVVAFYFYNNKRISKLAEKDIEQEKLIEEIIANSLVDATCPCGNNNGKVPFFELEKGAFTCDKCSSRYRIEMVLNPVLITEPVNLENAYEVLKNKELE